MLNAPRIRSTKDLTAVRQLVELQKQIPTLYGLLSVNACALAVTHYPCAPSCLTLGLPGALIVVCMMRAVQWWRMRPETLSDGAGRPSAPADDCADGHLFSVAFVSWAMILNALWRPL